MDTVKRYITGRHSAEEIRWHLAVLVVVYWGLVLAARWGYPPEHHYSIMTHTLSALGSFDNRHNPQWYWLFSIAMVYCGIVMTPVMLYIRRQIAAISEPGAWVGAFFFVMGCLMIALTGLFPDAHGRVIGHVQYRQIHQITAGLIGVAFALGMIWHGGLLLCDKLRTETFVEPGQSPYLRLACPFLVCMPVLATIGYRVQWGPVWQAVAAAANASGREATLHLTAASRGLQTFPFLEHEAIWALTLFVVWFATVLPSDAESEAW